MQIKGYNTKQKTIIIDMLKNNKNRHLTADEMLRILDDMHSPVGKATLYRFLDVLVSTGDLRKYINVDGEYFPCSFTEGEEGWEKGISVLKTKDFVEDIWNHKKTETFRKKLCANVDENKCRNCPLFNV